MSYHLQPVQFSVVMKRCKDDEYGKFHHHYHFQSSEGWLTNLIFRDIESLSAVSRSTTDPNRPSEVLYIGLKKTTSYIITLMQKEKKGKHKALIGFI